MAYVTDPVAYPKAARDLFAQVEVGLKIEIGAVFPLREAAHALRELEARRTVGSLILVP
jgi:NADPH:quinone reductase